MDADVPAYLRTWSKEFSARADRVRYLIGDAHWLTDGHHKEALLHELISRYLPSNIEVSRGFIRSGRNQNDVSPEIDILLTDSSTHPAFLSEFGVTIAPPSSVRGHIEVKSTFDVQNFRNAVLNIKSVREVIGIGTEEIDVWSCAFFYSVRSTLARKVRLMRAIDKVVTELLAEPNTHARNRHNAFCELLPTCVVAVDHFIAFIDADGGNPRIRYFDAKDLSAPLAIMDMLSAIHANASPGRRSEADDLVSELPCPAPTIWTIRPESEDG